MGKIDTKTLAYRQKLPLDIKIKYTINRLRWFEERLESSVTPIIAFSGGTNSLVLLDIARRYVNPDYPAYFADTGVEFPEMRKFVKNYKNTIVIRPEKAYSNILKTIGYPITRKLVARYLEDVKKKSPNNATTVKLRLTGINSRGEYKPAMMIPKKWRFLLDAPFKISARCCDCLKKNLLVKFQRKNNCVPVIATLAEDSNQRESNYLKFGCMTFKNLESALRPMSFWTNDDCWKYIKTHNINYCEVYDMGYTHTGCISCGFGVHEEKDENRFQTLYKTHPHLWDIHVNKYGWGGVLQYLNVNPEPAQRPQPQQLTFELN